MNINKISILCNSLNAQEILSKNKYLDTGDQREADLTYILRQAQVTILELQNEVNTSEKKCMKWLDMEMKRRFINGNSRTNKI